MTTGIDIIRHVVSATDAAISERIGGAHITFRSGFASTISSEVTQMMKSQTNIPFPLFGVFTENMEEQEEGGMLRVTMPKVVIACRALPNLTEGQRLATSFDGVLLPIFVEFSRQMDAVFPYSGQWSCRRSDVPLYGDAAKSKNALNQIVDAIVIKNLKFNFIKSKCNG